MVSSKEGDVPDHLSPRKDTSLLAPIVPLYAKTRNLGTTRASVGRLDSQVSNDIPGTRSCA